MKKKGDDVAKAKKKSKGAAQGKTQSKTNNKASKNKVAKGKAASATKQVLKKSIKTAKKDSVVKPSKKASPVKAKAKTAKSAVPAKAPQSKSSAKKITTQKQATSKSKAKLLDVSHFVTPLDDRLVVQLNQAEKITPGGLIIPDTVSDVSGHYEGTVLAVGRGHRDRKGRLRPMDVRQGDRVVFSSMAGSKLHYQSVDLIILRETDVMGVLD